MIRKLITVLCTAAVACIATTAYAADTEVVEAFGCNFNDGKTMADLDSAVAYYTAERSKVPAPALQKMVSRVWSPMTGTVPVDFVWFNSNMTYTEWGQIQDAMTASTVGAAIQARFDAAVTCPASSLWASETLHNTLDKKPFVDDGRVVVESFRCQLNPGKTIADTDAAIAAWKPVFAKAVAATGASTFVARRIPLVSGTGFDLTYLAVWDDATSYAKTNEAFMADPDNAKSGALFGAAHRCETALFNSRTVVPPPN